MPRGGADVTITANERTTTVSEVILGIDTHKDVHVAVALNQLGRHLGELSVPTTTKGYEKLLRWAEGFGPVGCAGVEGTGSYGAGLARRLKAAGISVMEVERPKRRHLRRKGKGRTLSMRRLQLGWSWPTIRLESQRAVMVRWR
jgi:transposase